VDRNSVARQAIDRLVQSMATAWNKHDVQAYAEHFAEDADFTNVFGILVHGRAAIERSHASIFRTMFRDSRLTVEKTSVRFHAPNLASVDVRWSMVGARDPQGMEWPERYGLISAVAVQSAGGSWSFAVFHNQDLPSPERAFEIARLLS
jgi:uncharacterized protein (TIGR02246 family)